MSGPLTSLAEQVVAELGIPASAPMTDEQAAEFREEFGRRCAGEASEPIRVLPSAPLLTPELARALIRECVTVVKPGETLVIRLKDWTPDQVEMYQEWLNHLAAEHGVKVLAVVGEELGIAEAPTAAATG